MIAADAYGNFIPGDNGLPQYVTGHGLVEGNLAFPVKVPTDVKYFETPFLTDIAHNADPGKPCLTATDVEPRDPAGCLTPDIDESASADFANQPAGTYDNEMLDAHFAAGDGRVNENIGLTAIHQVFHSEHDRLVDDIKRVLTTDTSDRGVAALAEWQSAAGAADWNGERLFQAARFITEMEYQHLVFEEFARKIQPAINPFEPFAFTQTELNPAVKAEFAHAVYRFGHSMLTETIDRRNEDRPGGDDQFGTSDDILGTKNDVSLLEGFLNPPEYTDGGPAGPLTSEEAAGSIIMGMSDQVGNELDEFVTETLRNNLLGLPLDLATINMTRARSEGVPRLNALRRELFNATNDGQLKPYTNWIDFGEGIKHPESLVNFVAAYGQHPTILTDAGPDVTVGTPDDGPATLASRRAAARAIVSPDVTAGDVAPADAADFMNSIGPWANDGTKSVTGLDNVDLWIGGLAEQTVVFGGLLGSTFNYVFENQLTDLQNGDRLYYLARTPGMNLRTQLEGNSFAELMMRNTNAHTLKADAFATADCKFELKKLAGTAQGFIDSGGNRVADDPDSECSEPDLLIRMPDGTIKYRARNTIDPSGINGQSVYNGTAGVDRVSGGNDSDTFWGGLGNDIIEGGDGADVALGGEGNDIITDLAGDDVHKGGPGNDAINAGPGLDIIMGGDGKDFTNGGANANETFGGVGDDFISLGQGIDAAFGDSGDDWEEGGDQPDLMIGDSSNLFFLDDSQKPGHDILIGQGGDDDYDMEGGDDVGVAGPGVEKVAGASGYDWEIGQGDPQPQDADLALPIAPLDILQAGVRDKFNEVEALSGAGLNDTLRGDDLDPKAVGGGGFIGCDVLDQAGLDRIAGLDALVPPLNTPLGSVVAASASNDCPLLSGPNVWGDGNILLGGGGSDLMEGRGFDDIIDGDAYFNVRLSVRTDAAVAATEIGSATGMTTQYLRDGDGALTGPTLQEAVFAGTVDPGNIVAVREILTGSGGTDTAVFSDVRANYTVTTTPVDAALGSPGSVTTVVHNGAGIDGTDTLRNVEVLQFSDSVAPNAPAIGTATAGNGRATVNFTAPTVGTANSFSVRVLDVTTDPAGVEVGTPRTAPADATSLVVAGLNNGSTYKFQVAATNDHGTSPFSAASNAVTPSLLAEATAPGAPAIGTATAGNASATLTWTAPASDGGSPITGYRVQAFAGTTVAATQTVTGNVGTVLVTGLTNGTAYTFDVAAINAVGTGAASAASNLATPVALAGAPTIGTATAGDASATLTWTAPASNGGSTITGYSVRAFAGTTLVRTQAVTGNISTVLVTGLTNGTAYTFDVAAINGAGTGAASAASNPATPAALAGAPTIGTATAGNASATLTWTAPASNGGSAITGYRVRALAGTTVVRTQEVTGNVGTVVVTALSNGTAYTFDVAAVNAVGVGAASAASNQVRPATLAGAPTIGSATAGNASATLTWTAPASNGGSAITGYQVRAFAGTTVARTQTVTGNVGTVVVTGLTNGTAYTFDVAATNGVGTGAASAASNPATPAAPATPVTVPGAPTIGTATAGVASATVRWTAPASNGGSAITGYRVRAYAGTTLSRTQTVTGNVGSAVVTGLTNGNSYRFDVAAINAAGTGAASATTLLFVTPRAEFVLPTITARTPATGARSVSQVADVTATFSEPVTGVNSTNIVLRLDTTVIPAVVSYNATTRVATLNPTATLLADRTYTATASGIRDAAGNTMAASSWSFLTGPAPTVTATSAVTAVPRNSNVTATFSEIITGFSTSTVQITNVASGAVVTSALTFNPLTRVLTINPSATLAAGTQYRVQITGGTAAVRDTAGNPLTTRTWTFTTGSAL
ncbi:Ca2+-binding RTX toxin-like protein [Arthrobacter sp. V4I6]|uniref:fibronectin type III domain-containing protein n=1 Tax=unclassified Arthrobacter TaxID=235627 RepID=UPI00278167FE|nr:MULTISPECIES: fibronectin type III domain-containing protein [unclassified Arthrobacter]MDQ0821165.1 Ca2+-binding RTX toxin-like protein [Arthrobacter sp. V1I7]MDQ0855428.1 Ca2+-binding RTX toxin-like protein [Arthrobacter sp. V4I6]